MKFAEQGLNAVTSMKNFEQCTITLIGLLLFSLHCQLFSREDSCRESVQVLLSGYTLPLVCMNHDEAAIIWQSGK